MVLEGKLQFKEVKHNQENTRSHVSILTVTPYKINVESQAFNVQWHMI